MSNDKDLVYSKITALIILLFMLGVSLAWLMVYVVSFGVVLLWLLEVFLYGASQPAY